MTSISARLELLVLTCAVSVCVAEAEESTDVGGHTKLGIVTQQFPSDSVFRDLLGNQSTDSQADLRLNLKHRRNGWTLAADYQLIARHSEALTIVDDDRRLMDLTAVIERGDEYALQHRLDRLSLTYSSEKTVIRAGRQALSWGNSLFYAPMDLVNPFNPATIDTEYKAGDDMVYFQYLLDNGSDLQAAYVFRRDGLGKTDSNVASMATKYHGYVGDGEYDVLIARHYGDGVLGLGLSHGIGGAQWGADLVVTDTDFDTYVQLTSNLSYSWVAFDKNMSGTIEYHFNGFGLQSDRYDPIAIAGKPDLLERLQRGESFALGRHYLAGSLLVELTPLWTVSPTVLLNAGDPSTLLQLITSYSVSDNITFLGSVNVPVGNRGSEFGGVESQLPGRYFSTTASVFGQIAWYF